MNNTEAPRRKCTRCGMLVLMDEITFQGISKYVGLVPHNCDHWVKTLKTSVQRHPIIQGNLVTFNHRYIVNPFEIYRYQKFRTKYNTQVWSVWNVSSDQFSRVKLAVGAGEWWFLSEVTEMLPSFGLGMIVSDADGRKGTVTSLAPNRVVCITYPDLSYKTFQEQELLKYNQDLCPGHTISHQTG